MRFVFIQVGEAIRRFGGLAKRNQARTKRRLPLSHVGKHRMNVVVESRRKFFANTMDLCDDWIFPHDSGSHEFFWRAYGRHAIAHRLAHRFDLPRDLRVGQVLTVPC